MIEAKSEVFVIRTSHWLLTCFVFAATTGCSTEELKRTAYETVQGAQQHECSKHPASQCPERESYEDYSKKRDNL